MSYCLSIKIIIFHQTLRNSVFLHITYPSIVNIKRASKKCDLLQHTFFIEVMRTAEIPKSDRYHINLKNLEIFTYSYTAIGIHRFIITHLFAISLVLLFFFSQKIIDGNLVSHSKYDVSTVKVTDAYLN